MRLAIIGASGYGNVGDDMYPEVFKRHLAGHELSFYNSDVPAQMPDADLYIVGGGGVLYNNGASPDEKSPHFQKITAYLDHAISAGIPYGFSSCGFQFGGRSLMYLEKVDQLKLWGPYLRECAFATFRSASCLDYFRVLSGRSDGQSFPDLGYLIRVNATSKRQVSYIPTSFASIDIPAVSYMINLLEGQGHDIVCIRMGAAIDDQRHVDKVRSVKPSWRIIEGGELSECAQAIAESTLVISGRYHGCVIAKANGVPFVRTQKAPNKHEVEDWGQNPDDAIGHIRVIGDFLLSVPDKGSGDHG